MVLVLAGEGPLGEALRSAVERRGPSRSVPLEHDDLFGSALGCAAIVYAPAGNLLHARLAPRPDPSRVRRVLGATEAPGVRLLVMVVPPGYEEEEKLVRKYGVPYVIVHAPPLVEELALESELRAAGHVWLPRGRKTVLGATEQVVSLALRALDDGALQGDTVDAPSETLDAAEAVRRAAKLAGRDVIRTVPPALDTVVRAIPRLFGFKGAPLESLHARIALADRPSA
jgi:hypothetical protein